MFPAGSLLSLALSILLLIVAVAALFVPFAIFRIKREVIKMNEMAALMLKAETGQPPFKCEICGAMELESRKRQRGALLVCEECYSRK